jgi:hypothetical protein
MANAAPDPAAAVCAVMQTISAATASVRTKEPRRTGSVRRIMIEEQRQSACSDPSIADLRGR